MKISEISYVSPSFGAIVPVENTVKDAAQNSAKRFRRLEKSVMTAASLIATGCIAIEPDSILKGYKISDCKADGQKIKMHSGYNGGFYIVDTGVDFEELNARKLVAQALELSPTSFGGLINYMDMVRHLKRQDIIQKGIKQYDYELNAFVPFDRKKLAAEALSKFTDKDINQGYLFFMGEEAFYYDMYEKTAYSVNYMPSTIIKILPTYRVCKFDTDKTGSAIGYKLDAPDIYKQTNVEYTYKEQQEPSDILPQVADISNNKLFAECFRFGNAKPNDAVVKFRYPKVLEHLSKRAGVKNPNNEMLQYVNLYDKDKEIISRICYYDATTGRSLVYDKRGNYMYQLEYNRDAFGNIRACTKF